MTGVPFLLPYLQVLDDDGSPLTLGTIETYEAGTNNALQLYTDQTLTVQQPFPLPLDAAGRAIAYAEDRAYKVIVKRADGTLVRSEDGFRFGAASVAAGASLPDWLMVMTL